MKLPRIDPAEVQFSAIRAQGAGGQNVNKVSNAVHLRFHIRTSSLPDEAKSRLLALADQRLSSDGVIVIKAQTHRSLTRNQADALARLQALVEQTLAPEAPRVPTRSTKASKRRRLEGKAHRGEVKAARQRVQG